VHHVAVARQFVQALKDSLLANEILPVEHAAGHVGELVDVLDGVEILTHLILCDVNQIENACQLLLNILHGLAEGARTVATVLW
jgi:hypothetical protein